MDYIVKVGIDIIGIVEINLDVWKFGDLDVKIMALDIWGVEVVKGMIWFWISEKK